MPLPFDNIDEEIQYILTNWIQNNNQYITGTIGQNVVWNLAQFIKKNPENWNRAKVVATSSNYTTSENDCIVIFTNDAEGELDFTGNIWNKYYFVNGTNNNRFFFNGKSYIDINGNVVLYIAARTSVYIAKGDDDNWYEINTGANSTIIKQPIIGVVGAVGLPVENQSLYTDGRLIGLGTMIQISLAEQLMSNYGNNSSFTFNPTTGTIDISPNIFFEGDSLFIDLNQGVSDIIVSENRITQDGLFRITENGNYRITQYN